MRSQTERLLGIGAILVGSLAVGAGCVTSEGSSDPASEAIDPASEPTKVEVSTGGTTTSSTEGGAGGEAGAAEAGAPATTAGAGGVSAAGAGAGGVSAGGVAGVQCLGDTWDEEPDCSALPTCAEASGGAGGGADEPPVGVADCEYYVEYMRQGVAEAFAECVASLEADPCDEEAYQQAVDNCEAGVTSAVCESPSATEHCKSVNCSSLGDECVSILSVYPEATQQTIMTCYDDSGDDGTADCYDTFIDCEAGE